MKIYQLNNSRHDKKIFFFIMYEEKYNSYCCIKNYSHHAPEYQEHNTGFRIL